MSNNQHHLNSESLNPNASEIDPILANESDPNSPPNQVEPIVNIDHTDVPPAALDGAGPSFIPYQNEDGDRLKG